MVVMMLMMNEVKHVVESALRTIFSTSTAHHWHEWFSSRLLLPQQSGIYELVHNLSL
jgi:hypothetical protein